jgi:hypothetical protein
MTNIVPFEHQRTLAASLVKSGLFGLKDEAQALALMALCEAEGMHPAQAIRDYHIVQGRPAMKADAMLARFQRAGGSVHWPQYTDEKVVGVFSHPQGGSVSIEWSIERAKRAKLANKDVWKHYPRNMLRARCISEGVRAVYPGIAVGIYTPEELQDMPAAHVRDMGGVEIVTPADPWTDDLRASATEAATQGMSAYTAWWKAQSDEFRTVAVKTATHADMKALAAGKAAA